MTSGENMNIRRAQNKDAEKIIELLNQVLELHAHIRPDIFVSGTTKYSRKELLEIISDDNRPIFVATDEKDDVMGYCFCVLMEQPKKEYMVQFKTIYIDDLCVDKAYRGRRVGTALFDFVKKYAKNLGCYDITLNVWEGNECAQRFYNKLGMRVKETNMEFIL